MTGESIEHGQERERDWIKVDLHIHTLDDPKDHLDYTSHQLLERARQLGFGALAITLHDKVFDRTEVYAHAAAMGILLIPAAEMRLEGADVVLLNVQPNEVEHLRTFADLRQLRARRGDSLFCFAPHPFFFIGASIGDRLVEEIDCFDAIEVCHFHKGWFDLNRRARKVAAAHRRPLLATSDAHRLQAFGAHYTERSAAARADGGDVAACTARRATTPHQPTVELARPDQCFLFRLHQASAPQTPQAGPAAASLPNLRLALCRAPEYGRPRFLRYEHETF